MITRNEARMKVLLDLQRIGGSRSGPEEFVILDEHTIERPWGWVFFYTTSGWRDANFRHAIAGNAPYIVNRFDGSLWETGTAFPIEHYIQEYEAELKRAKTRGSSNM